MTKRLEGTVALVTGASSGIGEATAAVLADEGAAVALVARRRDRLEALAERIGSDARTLVIEADITDQAQAQQAVATAASSLVSQGMDSMTNIQAELGSTQSAVTNANSSMSSQLTILQQQVGNLDDVNANTTAAQINSLTNQIQMAYELTSRLQQLNLAQYLPVP